VGGLAWVAALHLTTTKRKDKRRVLVQGEVRASLEEQRASRMIGIQKQGAWKR